MTIIHNAVDSIVSPQTTGASIPAAVLNAPVVLAYSGGNSWPTFVPYAKARPDLHAKNWVIPITLSCTAWGHCYDIEPGGGQNRNIGVFMHNAVNVWKTHQWFGLPWLYTFASNGRAMLDAAASFGYKQGRDFYYLSSHASGIEHICGPHTCGFPQADGTQFKFAGAVDYSVLTSYMLHQPKPPPPPPPPVHASGVFKAEIDYDHDKAEVTVNGLPSAVKTWGTVDEIIKLEIDLPVGTKPGNGRWSGRVSGRAPR